MPTAWGGDDRVLLPGVRLSEQSEIDMGEGEDQLVTTRQDGRLGLDLKRRQVTVAEGGVAAYGIKDAFLMAPAVTMVGDTGDNELSFNGCSASLRGGNSDDLLSNVAGDPWFDTYSFDCKATPKMYGGPGKDRLRGGAGADRLRGEAATTGSRGRGGKDVLLGGRGRDKADGGRARDRCGAESERRCER